MPRNMSKQTLLGALSTALTLTGAAHAADERRDVDTFYAINYALPFEVEFVQGDQEYVLLEGDEDVIEDVITEIKDGTLRVYRRDRWFNWNDGKIVVTIGFEEIDSLALAGSGDGFVERIDSEDLTLAISGSASLEAEEVSAKALLLKIAGSGDVSIADLDADSISTKIAGSGDIELAGRSDEQEITIAGSGDYDGRRLRSDASDISIKGSGDVEVWAESQLDVSIMGSGDVRFYGDPTITERINGSGSVEPRGKPAS